MEQTMNNTQAMNRNYATVGWGALLIWWGIVIVIDPLTLGMGAIGTGVILLAVSAARLVKGIPAKGSTIALGVVALVWGILDQALALRFGPSFATLLIVIGVVMIASLLTQLKNA